MISPKSSGGKTEPVCEVSTTTFPPTMITSRSKWALPCPRNPSASARPSWHHGVHPLAGLPRTLSLNGPNDPAPARPPSLTADRPVLGPVLGPPLAPSRLLIYSHLAHQHTSASYRGYQEPLTWQILTLETEILGKTVVSGSV